MPAPWRRKDLPHVGQGHSVMISHRTRQCGCHSPRKNKCHFVSSLCHVVSCTVLWRTFEHGSYSRILARILRTSTCASTNHAVTMTAETSTRERALQTTTHDCMHAVGLVGYLARRVSPSPPHLQQSNFHVAHDTARAHFLGTLTCHDTTNMFWRPVFGR